MKRLIYLIGATALLLASAALAQQYDTVQLGGTISVTNTFQQVLPRDDTRHGCFIQNTGAALEYVYFGPIASATTANSIELSAASGTSAGGSVNCNIGPGSEGVIKAQVSITGTSTNTYVYASQ